METEHKKFLLDEIVCKKKWEEWNSKSNIIPLVNVICMKFLQVIAAFYSWWCIIFVTGFKLWGHLLCYNSLPCWTTYYLGRPHASRPTQKKISIIITEVHSVETPVVSRWPLIHPPASLLPYWIKLFFFFFLQGKKLFYIDLHIGAYWINIRFFIKQHRIHNLWEITETISILTYFTT